MRFKDFISAELKISAVVALTLFPVATQAERSLPLSCLSTSKRTNA